MKIILVILALLACAAIAFLVVLLFGLVRCAEAQEECSDDLLGKSATVSGEPHTPDQMPTSQMQSGGRKSE